MFSRWGIFNPKFCIFGKKFADKKKAFGQAKILGATAPPHQILVCLKIFFFSKTLLPKYKIWGWKSPLWEHLNAKFEF